jgi:hypothetical protein
MFNISGFNQERRKPVVQTGNVMQGNTSQTFQAAPQPQPRGAPLARQPMQATQLPPETQQMPFYRNPEFYHALGQFGAAIAPEGSWQQRLGNSAAEFYERQAVAQAMNNPNAPASSLVPPEVVDTLERLKLAKQQQISSEQQFARKMSLDELLAQREQERFQTRESREAEQFKATESRLSAAQQAEQAYQQALLGLRQNEMQSEAVARQLQLQAQLAATNAQMQHYRNMAAAQQASFADEAAYRDIQRQQMEAQKKQAEIETLSKIMDMATDPLSGMRNVQNPQGFAEGLVQGGYVSGLSPEQISALLSSGMTSGVPSPVEQPSPVAGTPTPAPAAPAPAPTPTPTPSNSGFYGYGMWGVKGPAVSPAQQKQMEDAIRSGQPYPHPSKPGKFLRYINGTVVEE